jgi:hypothetical protein
MIIYPTLKSLLCGSSVINTGICNFNPTMSLGDYHPTSFKTTFFTPSALSSQALPVADNYYNEKRMDPALNDLLFSYDVPAPVYHFYLHLIEAAGVKSLDSVLGEQWVEFIQEDLEKRLFLNDREIHYRLIKSDPTFRRVNFPVSQRMEFGGYHKIVCLKRKTRHWECRFQSIILEDWSNLELKVTDQSEYTGDIEYYVMPPSHAIKPTDVYDPNDTNIDGFLAMQYYLESSNKYM